MMHDCSLHIFMWFNSRHPEEMADCLDAWDARECDTDGSPEGPDRNGLDGEAATAGAEGIAQLLSPPPSKEG